MEKCPDLIRQYPAHRKLRDLVLGEKGGLGRFRRAPRLASDDFTMEIELVDVVGKRRHVALAFPVKHREQAGGPA